MARIDTLENFLVDVATAIREKRHTTTTITPADYDTEILAIDGGGGSEYTTAVEGDVLFPKTFYSNGVKLTGTIQTEYDTSSASLYTKHNLQYNTGGIAWWSTICLGDYTFFYYTINSSNVHIVAIKNNTLEAVSQTFTFTELYGTANGSNCYMTYDSYTADEYILCPGHCYNDGRGGTYGYTRRIKYVPADGTFEILPGIAGFYASDTGNNNSVRIVGSQSRPNKLIVQWSYWTDRLNFSYCNITWTETAGTCQHIYSPGRISSYNWGVWETGDGHDIACNSSFVVMNELYTSGSYCNAAGKLFVSHNREYGIMNNVLYKLTPSYTASTMYNSRVQIQGDLPSYSIVEFTEDDDYALLMNGNLVYVVRFDDNGWTLDQTINAGSGNTTGSPWTGRSFVSLDSAYNMYLHYYTAEERLVAMTKDNLHYRLLTDSNSPANSNLVLADTPFVSKTGEHIGTMPNNGQINITPTTSNQSIPAGYTSGGTVSGVTAAIDNNITGDNIKQGVEILGVTGTFMPTGGDATSDANIQAKYLLEGYEVVSDGEWIQGTMRNYGTTTIQRTSEVQEIPTGYYDLLTIPIAQAQNLDGYEECLAALEYVNTGGVSV